MATKTKAVRSYTPAKATTVAEYITAQIALSGKDQVQIAQECGFNKPNVITMIKQGKTKVPLERIGPLAKSLGIDAVFLFKMVIGEYMPTLLDSIQAILDGPVLSLNEMEFIEVIRSSKVQNPKLRNEEERRTLRRFVDTLKSDNEV
jgi:hypothetical protein